MCVMLGRSSALKTDSAGRWGRDRVRARKVFVRLGKDGLTHEVVFEQEPSSWKQKQVQRPCGGNFRACSGTSGIEE